MHSRRRLGRVGRPLNFVVRPPMKPWQSVLLAIVAAAAVYVLWRFPPARAVTSVLMAIGAAWLGRSMYRSKLTANPMGENRNYSLRPVAIGLAKAAGSFVAALFWAVLTGYAVRLGYLSDTWYGAGVVLAPSLILLAVSVIYVINAMAKFQVGGDDKPPAD